MKAPAAVGALTRWRGGARGSLGYRGRVATALTPTPRRTGVPTCAAHDLPTAALEGPLCFDRDFRTRRPSSAGGGCTLSVGMRALPSFP